MSYLYLVEAETFGVGKTTHAARCATRLAASGFTVGGVLCLAAYEGTAADSKWIGFEARLLPGRRQFPLARFDRPGWELRNSFPEHIKEHARLEQRRDLRVNPAAAGICLDHMLRCIEDSGIDAVVYDEVGTILGGQHLEGHDPRQIKVCRRLPQAGKAAAVVTFQLRNQKRPHIRRAVDALWDWSRTVEFDHLVLDGLHPIPDAPPPALAALRPARA